MPFRRRGRAGRRSFRGRGRRSFRGRTRRFKPRRSKAIKIGYRM